MSNDTNLTHAVEAFSALSHETRLIVFKAIMEAGPQGLTAGALAEHAGVSPSNLSAHLNIMTNSGLISVRRDGRKRIYAAQIPEIAELVRFIVDDCCQGHPEICAQLPSTKPKSMAG